MTKHARSETSLNRAIKNLVTSWASNPHRSDKQVALYGDKLLLDQIWHGHPNALRLLEDGQDGLPVWGDVSLSKARKARDSDDANRYSLDALARLAVFFGLGLVGAAWMMVKEHWERLVWSTVDWYAPFEEYLDEKACHTRHSPTFRLGPTVREGIYRALGEAGLLPAAIRPDILDATLDRLVSSRAYLLVYPSSELAFLWEQERKSLALLVDGTPAEQDAFLAATQQLLHQERQLAELLDMVHDQRLRNANVETAYLARHGDAYRCFKAVQLRCERLARLAELLAQGLDRDEAARLLGDSIALHRRTLDLLELHGAIPIATVPVHGGRVRTPEEERRTKARKRTLQVALFKLVHHDLLQHHPGYAKLSERGRAALRQIYDQVVAIRDGERGFSPGHTAYSERSVVVLEQLLEEAQSRLAFAALGLDPGDLNATDIARGDTLPERLTHVQRQVTRLGEAVLSAEGELKRVLTDPEARYMESRLDYPDDLVAAELAQRVDRLRLEVAERTAALGEDAALALDAANEEVG